MFPPVLVALFFLIFVLPAIGLPASEDTSTESFIHNNLAPRTNSVPTISAISINLLYQNNLNPSTSSQHISGLLTGRVNLANGPAQCTSFNESPMPFSSLQAHQDDFLAQFNYLCFKGILSCPTGIWVDNGVIEVQKDGTSFSLMSTSQFSGQSLPQLCTQSDTGGTDANSAPSSTNQVIVQGNQGNTYQGYHNKKAFRFYGVPFSNKPGRFEYSSANSATNTKFTVTEYGAKCPQAGSSSTDEDCLFLNIHTPYLPASGSSANLRPVVVFIHGGAFVNGDGSGIDGDNMASREDVVMVSINYRLNTYGFMAVSSSTLAGNYGISDMVSALDWVRANIARFGGNPNQITIAGQSAGAAGVRILLGSSQSIGKFQRAIVMSNLGGGVDLGSSGDIGTTNSDYDTIAQSFDRAGQAVLAETNCNTGTAAQNVACLKMYNGDLSKLSTTSRFPVQDGTYIATEHLQVGTKGSVANIPVMMGNMANDGASFTDYSPSCTSEVACLAANLGISTSGAQSVVNSGLFPSPNTGDLHADSFNVSQLVRTDDTFRCIDQATAYAAVNTGSMGPVYYYQYQRSYGGYAQASKTLVDGTGPKTSAFPNGNPNEPYYRLHSGELGFAFGTQTVFRDDADYGMVQLMTAYWGAFIRTGDPNPDTAWLSAKQYTTVLNAVKQSGPWNPVSGQNGPIMQLDFPSTLQNSFNQVQQCNFLNYPLNYYLS